MASEFATSATQKAFKFVGFRFNEAEQTGIAKQLDAQLSEVREVLQSVLCSGVEFEDGRLSYQVMQIEHADLERARALVEKLKVED